MDALFSYRPDEKPFIGYLFQRVAGAHQILNSLSDISTVAEPLTVACQRRWYGSLAVQEAAMLCQKQLHRILLLAVLGLSLGAMAQRAKTHCSSSIQMVLKVKRHFKPSS